MGIIISTDTLQTESPHFNSFRQKFKTFNCKWYGLADGQYCLQDIF